MVYYPATYMLPDIPRECGKSLKSKPGEVCKCPVTHLENGEWTCGRHRFVPKMIQLSWTHCEPQECSICMETCQTIKHSLLTTCNHVFHKKCITKWSKNKPECPLCRTYLLEETIDETEDVSISDIEHTIRETRQFDSNEESNIYTIRRIMEHLVSSIMCSFGLLFNR